MIGDNRRRIWALYLGLLKNDRRRTLIPQLLGCRESKLAAGPVKSTQRPASDKRWS